LLLVLVVAVGLVCCKQWESCLAAVESPLELVLVGSKRIAAWSNPSVASSRWRFLVVLLVELEVSVPDAFGESRWQISVMAQALKSRF